MEKMQERGVLDSFFSAIRHGEQQETRHYVRTIVSVLMACVVCLCRLQNFAPKLFCLVAFYGR